MNKSDLPAKYSSIQAMISFLVYLLQLIVLLPLRLKLVYFPQPSIVLTSNQERRQMTVACLGPVPFIFAFESKPVSLNGARLTRRRMVLTGCDRFSVFA